MARVHTVWRQPGRAIALLGCCLLLWPDWVAANKNSGPEPPARLTSALFFDNRPPAQDGSGRTERLQRLILRHDQQTPPGWAEQATRLRALPPKEQLQAVHAFINQRLRYVDHGNAWQTPREAFSKGGVCVEFAVSKMLLLRDAGFNEAALRVVTLRPLQAQGIYHVVLLARLPDGSVYVLDSPERAQSAEIVPLSAYRERIRPVIWAGWRGGFSSNDLPQSGDVSSYIASRGSGMAGLGQDRTSRFASGDRLVDIAADLRLVRPGEKPLNASERQHLALLRRYYHDPTPGNGAAISAEQRRKLNAIRARLDRDEWNLRAR
ncbi:MAG: transglutaminase-like cysteine peptidase [Magnetococcales bacterium]|nr:transglutaminase-like cysteine peptidase [Magnetococcales bacterium]MBF0113735.1 transglutaminase-like cysteine peptidase [Magnetococcales bacterium]